MICRDISYNQITGEIPYNIGFLQVATLYVCFYYAETRLNSSKNSDSHVHLGSLEVVACTTY